MSRMEAAIDGFRDAAIFPERWPQALDAVAQCLNSDGVTLLQPPTRAPVIAFSASIESYRQQYSSLTIPDPREQRVSPKRQEGFKADHDYFSPREILKEPYYQEFLVPNGFGWNAAAALDGGLLISLKRRAERGAYDEHELAFLNTALPGLRSASRVASIMWRSNLSGRLCLLERVDRGAVLLDNQTRVIGVNACVNFGDGLDVRGGTLQAARATDQRRLQRFLGAAIDPWQRPQDASHTLILPRPSGRQPWLLDAVFCADAVRSLHSRAALLVLITDVARPLRSRHQVLREAFGLTYTEACVAQELMSGRTLRHAAVELGISEGHARQRLKAVFGKTGTCRQVELVALLAKLT